MHTKDYIYCYLTVLYISCLIFSIFGNYFTHAHIYVCMYVCMIYIYLQCMYVCRWFIRLATFAVCGMSDAKPAAVTAAVMEEAMAEQVDRHVFI